MDVDILYLTAISTVTSQSTRGETTNMTDDIVKHGQRCMSLNAETMFSRGQSNNHDFVLHITKYYDL